MTFPAWQSGPGKVLPSQTFLYVEYPAPFGAYTVPVVSATNGVAIGSGAVVASTGISAVALGNSPTAGAASSVAIGAGATTATGTNSVALGNSYASGADSFCAAGADHSGTYGAQGANSVAIGKQAKATGANSIAIASGYTWGSPSASGNGAISIGDGSAAAATNSVAIGYRATLGASATNAVALGNSYAGGSESFCAANAQQTNTYGATGTGSIAMGQSAKASAVSAVAIGAFTVASANPSIALNAGTASGTYSICIGNNVAGNPSASASGSIVIGQDVANTTINKFALGLGVISAAYDSTIAVYNNKCSTTGTTPTVLTTDAAAVGATNQVVLPNNSAIAFSGQVVARQKTSDGTASAAWNVEGLIRRDANAASTTLVASTVTAISNVPGWTLALTADTTRGALAITATGATTTNIRWSANIQTVELVYV